MSLRRAKRARVMPTIHEYEFIADFTLPASTNFPADLRNTYTTNTLDWTIDVSRRQTPNGSITTEVTISCCPEKTNPQWLVEVWLSGAIRTTDGTWLSKATAEHKFGDVQGSSLKILKYNCKREVHSNNLCVEIETLIVKNSGLRFALPNSIWFTVPSSYSNCWEPYRLGNILRESGPVQSEFFKQKLVERKNSGTSEPIDLSDWGSCEMRQILGFVNYRDNRSVNRSTLDAVAKIAFSLQFDPILVSCEEIFLAKRPANRKDAVDLLNMAIRYDFQALQRKCELFLGSSEFNITVDSGKVHTGNNAYLSNFRKRYISKLKLNKKYVLYCGVKWNIELVPVEGGVTLQISPFFENTCENNWMVAMKFSLGLQQNSLTTKVLNFWAGNHKQMEYFKIPGIATDPRKRDSQLLQINMEIMQINGLRYFIWHSDNMNLTDRNELSTVRLKMEDEIIFKNIQLLSHYSDYFKAQCAHLDQVEVVDGLPTIVLDDIPIDHMIATPSLLYIFRHYKPSEEKLRCIAPIADRLLIYKLTPLCDRTIMAKTVMYVAFATQYNLRTVLKNFKARFQGYNCENLATFLAQEENAHSYPDSARLALMNLLMEPFQPPGEAEELL